MRHRTYALVLAAALAALWIPLAFHPYDRKDWALENVLLVLACGGLAITYRRFPLSRVSYTTIFVRSMRSVDRDFNIHVNDGAARLG